MNEEETPKVMSIWEGSRGYAPDNKGKIIAIEGLDGAGKNTQAKLLTSYLTLIGIDCYMMSFPQYANNFFGKTLKEYLTGVYGDIGDIPPQLSAMLYACDRWESLGTIKKKLDAGTVIILDRYVPSNIIYQSARLNMKKVTDDIDYRFVDWVEKMEYEVFGLPEPDKIIFLDLNLEQTNNLMDTRTKTLGEERDLYESNTGYMKIVGKMWRELSITRNWDTIVCTEAGVLRTIDDIQNQIQDRVIDYLDSQKLT